MAAAPARPGSTATHTPPVLGSTPQTPHLLPLLPADYELIKRLEAARKVSSAGFYKLKKKAIAAVAKATKEASA